MKETKEQGLVSCLRDNKAIVRFVKKPNGFVTNPKNPQYGGMSIGSSVTLTVPLQRNGSYKNVLTDSEKAFLEHYLGLDEGALSVHKKENNYWENFSVILKKEDTIFNLSDPIDYIRYKVVLSNSDLVAPSLEDLQTKKLGTWRFVLINEGEELAQKTTLANAKAQAYILLGSIKENKPKVKTLIQLLTNKPINNNTKLDQMVVWATEEIEKDPKKFLQFANDETLDTKINIIVAIEYGIMKKRGNFYFMADNTPVCEKNEEPTIDCCVKYLNNPKNQAVYLKLQSLIKNAQE